MGGAVNVAEFVTRLGEERMPEVFNPWGERDPLDSARLPWLDRRVRLARHLDCAPRLLLIGEAPGYQGARFSGVPFTGEAQIFNAVIPRLGAWPRVTSRPNPWSEPSATIVWKALFEQSIAEQVVLWNAFPYHPHRADEPYSNRAPRRAELEAQAWALDAFLRLFPHARAVAVGRVAELALGILGVVPVATLRHPARGGANEFRRGLAELAQERA